MKSQFIVAKNLGLPKHQLDMSQQQRLSCPTTAPLSLTDQSTQPLLPFVKITAFTSELPSHDQTTAPTPELLSDDQTEVTAHEWEEEHKWVEEKVRMKKPGKLHLVLILVIIVLACAIYFIWHLPSTNSSSSAAPLLLPSPSSITNKGNSSSSTTTDTSNGSIQVYVTGAVKKPGIYILSSDARIYQLLDAAGGPLPNANLVALNLAEKLVDGQEVYVSQIGETPPVAVATNNSSSNNSKTSANSNNQGQLVNINTASAADLQKQLHLSAKSAQEIISYRQQHGPFQSIDEVQQAVSKTIYNKIKNEITV